MSPRPAVPLATLALAAALLAGCEPEREPPPGEPPRPAPLPEVVRPAADAVEAGDLAALERLWSAQRYQEVLPPLIEHRATAAYGRNEVVDYMIATSACRVPGQESLGLQMLAWIQASYSLNEESREMVKAEMSRCPPATRLVPVNLTLVGVGPASTSGTRGKMFYMLGRGEDVPVANEPVGVVRVIPPEELEARLFPPGREAEAVASVGQLAGPAYRALAEGAFVVASRTHAEAQMREIARGLTRYLEFYAATYGMPRPPHLVSVYLTSDGTEMRELAQRVHGIRVSRASIGYSFRDDLSMVGIIPQQTYGTMAHELFHLMVRRDFGDVPPWLDEGMAALYEVSRVEPDGRIRGTPNWRGPVLQQTWTNRPSVAELVRADWLAFEARSQADEPVRQAANHAAARYLILHLQERGLLPAVYRAFRERDALRAGGDPGEDAVATLERAVGRPAAALDEEFVAWFRDLRH
jgi:hypothetical protein